MPLAVECAPAFVQSHARFAHRHVATRLPAQRVVTLFPALSLGPCDNVTPVLRLSHLRVARVRLWVVASASTHDRTHKHQIPHDRIIRATACVLPMLLVRIFFSLQRSLPRFALPALSIRTRAIAAAASVVFPTSVTVPAISVSCLVAFRRLSALHHSHCPALSCAPTPSAGSSLTRHAMTLCT